MSSLLFQDAVLIGGVAAGIEHLALVATAMTRRLAKTVCVFTLADATDHPEAVSDAIAGANLVFTHSSGDEKAAKALSAFKNTDLYPEMLINCNPSEPQPKRLLASRATREALEVIRESLFTRSLGKLVFAAIEVALNAPATAKNFVPISKFSADTFHRGYLGESLIARDPDDNIFPGSLNLNPYENTLVIPRIGHNGLLKSPHTVLDPICDYLETNLGVTSLSS